MYNLTYLFIVLVFVVISLSIMLVHIFSMIYLNYLVVVIYVSGVVVFILYISCMCWNVSSKFSKLLLIFAITNIYLFDSGLFCNFSDLGESLWIYLFFSLIFNILVVCYSLNLFNVSGSLRF